MTNWKDLTFLIQHNDQLTMEPKITYSVRLILLVFTVLTLPIWVFAQESLQEDILIGFTPEINVFDQSKRYNHLFKYLERKTGNKLGRRILTQYGDVIENFTSLNLDGAFLGSFTAVLALNKLNLEPIARPVNLDGSSTYHGLIIVRKDSGIKNVKDMKVKLLLW